MFWSEIIDPAHDDQHRDGGQRRCDRAERDPDDLFRAGSDVTQPDQPLSAAVTVRSATRSSAPTTASSRPCATAPPNKRRRHPGNAGR